MDFWYEKEVGPGKEEKDAIEEPMPLKEGVIRHVWLFHPPGCMGLLHTQILHRGHQLWPTLKGGSYHGDGVPFEFDESWKIKKPAELTIRSWNVDDEYPHTVYIHITVLPEVVDPYKEALIDLVKIIKTMMGIK